MFSKILIANRGEIACRVAATARRLGIRTVAVYSDADARSRHVAACDEAWRLGPAPVRESYLRADLILEIARRTGAQAIHPGYGFLSENEAFAQAVADAGLVFIGPPPSAIRAMGLKAESKRLMQLAGVPLVPGYHDEDQDPALLRREADRIGYPVLIKASAGGGGKGMRVVERADQFDAALASCQREARNSFGDDAVLIERYVTRPRHIEIQVFGDSHGNLVHLFERDCSVQRRHQKVVEEAPAPGMTAERRQAMGEAAVAAARAVGYVGAGTIEFIADPSGEFFFMEMNTRLQVEHPVTEMITGQDLVEWQLRVADGQPLPLRQPDLRIDGHAIEARIYAENPDKGFLPSTGRLLHLAMPGAVAFTHEGGEVAGQPAAVRIDSGVREGDTISPFYDPMIAKLIVWGADRAQALNRMSLALAQCEAVGPATNVAFLGRLMRSPAFATADLDTALIEREKAVLLPPTGGAPTLAVMALAAAAVLTAESAAVDLRDRDPWSTTGGFRIGGPLVRRLAFGAGKGGQAKGEVDVAYLPDGAYRVTPVAVEAGRGEGDRIEESRGGDALDVTALMRDGTRLTGLAGGRAFAATVIAAGETLHLFSGGEHHALHYESVLAHAGDAASEGGRLTAPMPGKVIALLVEPGARVVTGQPLVVMEAMKMEHSICAPGAGKVVALRYAVGEQVGEGDLLLEFEAG